jgi:uncharacterized protein
MSDTSTPGTIAWQDLTVPNAEQVRDFYLAVVGWEAKPESMGEYSDFNMIAPSTGQTVAGVCHARGVNADVPPQWLIYIIVEDIDRAAQTCVEKGGSVVVGPRASGGGRICVIKDPAGATCALFKSGD